MRRREEEEGKRKGKKMMKKKKKKPKKMIFLDKLLVQLLGISPDKNTNHHTTPCPSTVAVERGEGEGEGG